MTIMRQIATREALLVCSAIGFLALLPALRGPGLPIEISDEGAHTLVELPLAHRAAAHLELLQINLFNNFGTPLLGDPVACAFAPHALLHVLLPGPMAMIASRVLFAFLTPLAVFLLLRSFTTPLVALLAALFTGTAPAFTYFLFHHPHQGVTFYYASAVWAYEVARRRRSRASTFGFYLASVAFLMGSSINGIVLGVPFLVAHVLLDSGTTPRRALGRLLPLAGALLTVSPRLLAFARWMPFTQRVEARFDQFTSYTTEGFVYRFAWLVQQPRRFHTDFSIHYSIPLLVLAVGGLVILSRRARSDRSPGERVLHRRALILGLLPFLLVMVMLRFRDVYGAIPLLRTMDVSRVLWFSNIYLLVLPAAALAHLRERVPERRGLGLLFALLLGVLLSLVALPGAQWSLDLRLASAAVALLATAAAIAAIRLGRVPAGSRALHATALGVLLGMVLPRAVVMYQMSDVPRSVVGAASFAPEEFLPHIERQSRLASGFDPMPMAPDLRAAVHDILGANGRSILLHGGFAGFLERRGLIARGWRGLTYHFLPAAPEVLGRFGIRYFMSDPRDAARLQGLGWRLVAEAPTPEWAVMRFAAPYVLFESPIRPTPFYLLEGGDPVFLREYELQYNTLSVKVPAPNEAREVVATFLDWPGWEASLDGEPLDLIHREDHFLRVRVARGGLLRFRFRALPTHLLLGGPLLGPLGMLVWLVSVRAPRGSS